MKQFIFKTVTTMKEYNNKKWWIDSNTVGDIYINSDSLSEALEQYRKTIDYKACIEISNNAMKNKQEMYVDLKNGKAKQVGYVITGRTDFQDDDGKLTSQYIDLWIEILSVIDTNFAE